MTLSTTTVRGGRRLPLGPVALLPLLLACGLALLSGVNAQIIDGNITSIIEPISTPVIISTTPIIIPITTPVIISSTSLPPIVISSTSVRPPPSTSLPPRPTTIVRITSTASLSSTPATSAASSATPTPSQPPAPGPVMSAATKKVVTWVGATFGIVAGSIALAVLGIYVFRKATLRPSSDFRKRMHRTQYGDGGSGAGSSTGLSTLHSNASHQNLNPYAVGATAGVMDDYRSSAGTPDGRSPARYHYDYPISDYASDAGGVSSPSPVAGTSRYAATQQQYAYYPTHGPPTPGPAGYASAAGSEYGGYSPSEYAQYPPQPMHPHDYGGGQQHHPAYSAAGGGGGGQYPAY
ncbi:hypothetical protein BDZ88DRAFT_486264 [Geranomyces variabilis]|nr:hypothetical protein BDZ88DRAFT_486264 [Geranomyces variabilis]KAJ3138678.1 hypothetical protein HDU90_001121 [Geranomyces variabilis]